MRSLAVFGVLLLLLSLASAQNGTNDSLGDIFSGEEGITPPTLVGFDQESVDEVEPSAEGEPLSGSVEEKAASVPEAAMAADEAVGAAEREVSVF